MAHLSAKNLPPEAEELERKQLELVQLEIELAENELEFTTLIAELAALERHYLEVVGRRYAELDHIEAKIAEELARGRPTDESAQVMARAARKMANESAEPTGDESFEKSTAILRSNDFRPTDELQRLYRQAARTLHPDLTTNPAEQQRRQRFMAELNEAYGKGDEEQIRQLLRQWNSCPESVEGEGTAAELVRVIRKIAQVRQRLAAIEREVKQTSENELSQLKGRVEEAARDGCDLLQEMAKRVDVDIAAAQRRWSQLVRGGSA